MKHRNVETRFAIKGEREYAVAAVVHTPEKTVEGRTLSVMPRGSIPGTKFIFHKSEIATVRAVAKMMLHACDLAEALRDTQIVKPA